MNWLEFLNGFKDVVIVVILGMGLKLLKQQNELLKAEKSLKESEIDSYKANIEHLRSLQSPGLARDLRDVTQTANEQSEKIRQMTDREARLLEQVKGLGAESAKALEGLKAAYLLGRAQASFEAVGFTREEIEGAHRREISGDPVSWPAQQARIESYLTRQAEEALAGKASPGFFSRLGSRGDLSKIQNHPTKDEVPKISPPEPDPDF